MSTFVDVHIVQSVPPSNLNRDEQGSPKTATFGGVVRARVSSQSWKRATRSRFAAELDESELGYRTLRLVELVAESIRRRDASVDETTAQGLAEKVLVAAGITLKDARAKDGATPPKRPGYLVFISRLQADRLAELALEAGDEAIDKKAAKSVLKDGNSVDLALFGRMVADDGNLNVDAAVQVAHALGTHAVEKEFDYFTAVDDLNPREETGAGMIGTVEFNAATLYRYATINVELLRENLGDSAAADRAIEAFVRSFVLSIPSGKQNTFAHGTLPDLVLVCVRDDQPVNLVGAFEAPVRGAEDRSITQGSVAALAEHARGVSQVYGPARTTIATVLPAHAAAIEDIVDATVPLADLPGLVVERVGSSADA